MTHQRNPGGRPVVYAGRWVGKTRQQIQDIVALMAQGHRVAILGGHDQWLLARVKDEATRLGIDPGLAYRPEPPTSYPFAHQGDKP